jgi:hypothetical protein
MSPDLISPASAKTRPEFSKIREERGTEGFAKQLREAIRAHATDEDMRNFAEALADPAYRSRFEAGYWDGRLQGAQKALERYVADLKNTATAVLGFYASVYDPVLWARGLQFYLSARGSKSSREAIEAIGARFETYTYFRQLEKVIPQLPKIIDSVVAILKDPGDAIGQVVLRATADLAQQISSTRDPYERGRALGHFVGRGITEALLLVVDIIGLPEMLAGKLLLSIPKLAQPIRSAASRLKRLPTPPARAQEAIEEAMDGVARQAAKEMDAATPRPFSQGPAPPVPTTISKLDEIIEEVKKLSLPDEVRGFTREQWQEVIEYARKNDNPFSVKGVMAEQLIEANPKFQQLVDRVRRNVEGEAAWDPVTLQYVRRAKGKAPTRNSGGAFRDLADGLIVVRAKNLQSKPQVFILAVFEAKSRSNRGDLVSRGGEELGQIGWDFERIRENPIELELQTPTGMAERYTFNLDEVKISRHDTTWVVTLPKGENLKPDELDRLRQSVSNLDQWNHELMDTRLQRTAEQIVKLVEESEL